MKRWFKETNNSTRWHKLDSFGSESWTRFKDGDERCLHLLYTVPKLVRSASYNALILGLCKEGKTKKAAHLVKELDRKPFVPNASTFSALIEGQCVRKNSDHAFKLCQSMIRSGYHPDEHTFNMLISSFCNNRDFDGAVEVLKEMFERSFALDSSILSDLCLGLRRCGNEKMVKLLCSEMEARRLIPQGFDKAKILSPVLVEEN